MNLNRLILKENACFKEGEKIEVSGIMIHSTGVNNPYLKRYVGPDDGKLGYNSGANHWNTLYPDGREVCVHAFIGKLSDGSTASYQTLPWNYRGWHAGGSANGFCIGFEICEDDLSDREYFESVYKEALELCLYLCKEFSLTEEDVIDHHEGCTMGIASSHIDVSHWFPKFGKSMDTFRYDLKTLLLSGESSEIECTFENNTIKKDSIVEADKLYKIQAGAFKDKKNAEALLISLKNAGFRDAYIKFE